MNIRKVLQYNVVKGIIEIELSYTTKGWMKIHGYKTRGYRNKLKRVGLTKQIKAYPTITEHIKRNRVHRIVSTPINLNEAE